MKNNTVNGKSVLVVDDDKSILEVFKTLLQSEGYSVETADNGRQAIEKAKETKFDIALLDIVLPDIRGDQVAVEIKKHDDSVRIIFITGYPSFQDCIDALDIGVSEILMKPVTSEELLTSINQALFASSPEAESPVF